MILKVSHQFDTNQHKWRSPIAEALRIEGLFLGGVLDIKMQSEREIGFKGRR